MPTEVYLLLAILSNPSKQHRRWWLHYRWPSVSLVKPLKFGGSNPAENLGPLGKLDEFSPFRCRTVGFLKKPKTTKNNLKPIYSSLDHPKNKTLHKTGQFWHVTSCPNVQHVFMTSNRRCQGCWIIILQWCRGMGSNPKLGGDPHE